VAVNDPGPSVATPTGALQGVAAFSWDGTNWQPTAGAGPDVATSTGVLRGVAPFSWDGAAWQPSGRAQPGVATPTGVLDGVAVYTWSGSAWTPTGGTATPSTPSGALRGVAAFSWDGAAWQPAGQAGPSVSTPYGVLAGVAMFEWSGSTWQAGAAVPAGATLDLSFLSGPPLDPRLTFSRASTATYFDSSGTMQTATTNAPRFDYDPVTHALRGLLIEEQRTNSLLNSTALGTQGVAVTAQAYTLSFYGTGTITMSGAFAGTLVGSGAFPVRVSQTFTPAAGTLTCTVTGSVLNAQLEAGGFSTSYIPTTAAAVTRGQEVCYIPVGTWFNAATSTLMTESLHQVAASVNFWQAVAGISDGGTTNRSIILRVATSNNVSTQVTPSYNPTIGALTIGAVTKAAVAWRSGQQLSALNGVTAGPDTQAAIPTAQLYMHVGTAGDGGLPLDGYIRRVRYWPRVLSNSELQAVTT
jgi:hypothetical protein